MQHSSNEHRKTDIIYYKIILDNQEVLITQHSDFAKYMFKFIRELTEYKADIQLIAGVGLKFENSFIMFDYSAKRDKKHLTK